MVIFRISLLFTQILSILYLVFDEFQGYYIFVELYYFIFVKLSYFEFELKCMHFFWNVKNLFSR